MRRFLAVLALCAASAVPSQAQVCDGVTNDTAAIQAAIDAAVPVGAWVELPAGTCRITADLVVAAHQGVGSKTLNWDGTIFTVAVA